jgi:hypothetical protein
MAAGDITVVNIGGNNLFLRENATGQRELMTYAAAGAALPAGSAIIGKVGIDQTTPGTTNGVQVNAVKGAANVAVAQTTTSTSAATLVAARATRRGVYIRNFDTSISVYIGPATVTSSNGMLLKAGESIFLTWVGLIQVIAASGTPVVGTVDEYD